MRLIVLAIVVGFFAQSAAQADVVIEKVKGVILESFFAISSFSIETGKWLECEEEINPGYTYSSCKLDDGLITMTRASAGGVEQKEINISQVRYVIDHMRGSDAVQYVFFGRYTANAGGYSVDEPVKILLRRSATTGRQLEGSIEMADAAVSAVLRGNIE